MTVGTRTEHLRNARLVRYQCFTDVRRKCSRNNNNKKKRIVSDSIITELGHFRVSAIKIVPGGEGSPVCGGVARMGDPSSVLQPYVIFIHLKAVGRFGGGDRNNSWKG
jgi:hypothetical protein